MSALVLHQLGLVISVNIRFTEKVMVKMIWQNKMAHIENVVLNNIVKTLRFNTITAHFLVDSVSLTRELFNILFKRSIWVTKF
jgi:hypothetical protein